jgi:TonB-linked SusC/RagA family outer membrane protein
MHLFTNTLRKSGLILLLVAGLVSGSFAQVRTISGTVSAGDTKETLPGATVQIKGTTIGAVTDIDGKYTIAVKSPEEILVFSFLGYTPVEEKVGDRSVINMTLYPSNVALNEVVVIGYGTVKKSDLTGAVSSIKADDITKITALNPVQSLQGQVTGVQVSTVTGTPGEKPAVRIRGIGSFQGNQPIYVVDGVILDDISFLNSNDIKSMEILKDASATAIYGSRGANGVILVTTKTGTAGGEKTAFSFVGEVSLQKLAHKIKLLNGTEYATVRNVIDPGTYNNVDAVPNTDWQDEIFHVAPMYNFQLSATGSTKTTQYYIAGGYFGQDGIIDDSYYQRITFKLNNIYTFSDYVSAGVNLNIVPFKQQIAPDVTSMAYRALPTITPYQPDGSYSPVLGVGNPLAALEYSANNYNKGIRGVGNVYIQLNFLKGFTFKTSFGVDGQYTKSVNFTPEYYVSSTQNNPQSQLYKGTSDNFTWLWENTLTYVKTFGKSSINALGGYTMQNTSSENMNVTGLNIIRDGSDFWYIYNTNLVSNYTTFKNGVDPAMYYSMISYLFRVNYTYNNRYILTGTFRRDGSSKFAAQNRYSNFPSVAAGWNMSQENFMKNIKFLSKLKIRGSWGQVGNEKIEYWSRFSRVTDYITILGTNNEPNPGASYNKFGNPDLQWEVSSQVDAGIEFGFFKDRLTGEFDYYNRVTDNLLVPLMTPGYLGNGQGQTVMFNAGKMVNRGIEFNLGWRDQAGKLNYSVSVLGSTVHNEVLEIGGNSGIDSVLYGGYLANGQPATQSSVGLPIGAFYGYKTDGIFQTQAELDAYPHMSDAQVGYLRFVDINGDGIINALDRTYIGSPIPKFIFGFSVDLQWNGFDFSLNISGQTGNDVYNAKEMVRPDPYNFEQHVLDYWTGPGTSTTEPKPSNGGYDYNISDKYIYDGSYLRIRNLTIGYTIPGELSKKIAMNQMRFYFKVDNLYTFTKFTGYTPEIGSEDVLSNGIDRGVYPVTSVYSLGVNLRF